MNKHITAVLLIGCHAKGYLAGDWQAKASCNVLFLILFIYLFYEQGLPETLHFFCYDRKVTKNKCITGRTSSDERVWKQGVPCKENLNENKY